MAQVVPRFGAGHSPRDKVMRRRRAMAHFSPKSRALERARAARPASEHLPQGRERALARQIEIAGKSGAVYRYTALEEDRVLPPAGANYVICKPADRGVNLLFVGETESLSRVAWREQLAQARETYGDDADVMTRLNVRSAVRQAEQDDLIEEHRPPMNHEARA